MDFNSAWLLVKVVQFGSFSQTSRNLQIPVSTISTKIAQLERELGVTLLTRTTRRLRLTPAGEQFFAHASRAVAELQEAQNASSRETGEARGVLRVTVPTEMGMTSLMEVMAKFLDQNPAMRIELILSDRIVDLVADGVDVAVRAGALEDSSLISRQLGEVSFQAYASPEYLKRRGAIRHPRDLERQECLRFTRLDPEETWMLSRKGVHVRVPAKGRFCANDLSSLRRLAIHARGIALLPGHLCREDVERGRLVPVLPEWVSRVEPFSVVYPQQVAVPRRVRAFVDHLFENRDEIFKRWKRAARAH